MAAAERQQELSDLLGIRTRYERVITTSEVTRLVQVRYPGERRIYYRIDHRAHGGGDYVHGPLLSKEVMMPILAGMTAALANMSE